jgi:hypothetical protein
LRRYALSDDQFARIEHLLPRRPGHVGRNSDKGNRLFVEAVIWKFRQTGARVAKKSLLRSARRLLREIRERTN